LARDISASAAVANRFSKSWMCAQTCERNSATGAKAQLLRWRKRADKSALFHVFFRNLFGRAFRWLAVLLV
jgi:hypothetical protein